MTAAPLLTRLLRLVCVALALALPAGFGPIGVAYVQQAGAQQAGDGQSGGGLLRFLFRRGEPQRQDRVVPAEPQRRATAPVRRAAGTPAAAPAEPAVEKSEAAKRVLVIGDFLAGGLAEGLASAYAQNPDVLVVDRTNGSSGLVRDDHYDWPGNIVSVIEAEKPAVVVVMIGSNDRQQMRVEGNREQPRTEAWTEEYERRVGALAKHVRETGLPLVWVGNLPFKSGAMSSDMIAFNDIYRRIVTDLGGEFVDVWDGFVDENGNFVANGPDMNGQPAQLRAADGINVTRPGRRKIAFYAEKPLNRLLDTGVASPAPARPGDGDGDGEIYGPSLPGDAPAVIDRTPPLAMEDMDPVGGAGLLGAHFSPRNGEPRTPAERLQREGVAPDPQPGRADDFAPRRPAPETTGAVRP